MAESANESNANILGLGCNAIRNLSCVEVEDGDRSNDSDSDDDNDDDNDDGSDGNRQHSNASTPPVVVQLSSA